MSSVTKREIVLAISDRTGLSQVDAGMIVESFLGEISSSLKQGKNIELRGFGRFKLKMKKARKARNPRTGEAVQVEAGIKPIFRASRELTLRVNSAEAARVLLASSAPPQDR
jgi:DNA-binding protein HU-beta/integration host factor subunit beta